LKTWNSVILVSSFLMASFHRSFLLSLSRVSASLISQGTLNPNLYTGPFLFLAKHICLQYLRNFFGFLTYLLAHFHYGRSCRFFSLTYWATVTGSSVFITLSGSQDFSPVSHRTSTSIICFPFVVVFL